MKVFKPTDKLTCIYCQEEQSSIALDMIPPVMNIEGYAPLEYQHGVQEDLCECCDSRFYVKLTPYNEVIMGSNPEHLYKWEEKDFVKRVNVFLDTLGIPSEECTVSVNDMVYVKANNVSVLHKMYQAMESQVDVRTFSNYEKIYMMCNMHEGCYGLQQNAAGVYFLICKDKNIHAFGAPKD